MLLISVRIESATMKLHHIFVIAGFLIGPNRCLVIVGRNEWGARPPTSTTTMITPVNHVVIHHSEGVSCTTNSTCEANARTIQNHHMDNNGWVDIGYNFLAGGDDRIYEGRGWNRVGAHAPGFSDRSIGICALGMFNAQKPPAGQIAAIKELIRTGVLQGWIRSNYRLIGHRQTTNTDCPGTAFYNEIQTWPNWVATPTYEDIIEGKYVYSEISNEFVPVEQANLTK